MKKLGKAKVQSTVCWLLLGAFVSEPALAQAQFYYPAQGQSQEQQAKDIGECQTWATQQTNFNPAYPPPPPPGFVPPPVEYGPDGSVIRGAARGAAVGAVAGEIFDDKAGKGAGAGAAAGALIGGMKRRQKRRAQAEAQKQAAEQNQQQQAAYQQQLDYLYGQYNRAIGVCMGGRGYSAG